MTAPLFHLPDGGLSGLRPGDGLTLSGEEGRHAATVRRIGPGEQVLLADGSGLLARAEVSDAGADSLELRLLDVRPAQVDQPRLVLVQALAKGDRDLQAIEAATELGVDAVRPWQAMRSIVQWRGERAAKAHRKWEHTVSAAAKQARRPTVPEVTPLVTRRDLPDLTGADGLVLVLHEDAERALTDVTLPEQGAVTVVVGPEGGIAPEELTALTGAGAVPVRLGPTVLRSSSAGPAALAVLAARLRW